MKKLRALLNPANTSPPFTPEWMRVNDAVRNYGIGRSSMFTLIRSGRIASRVLKTSVHNVSGLRLISTASLNALIEESANE